MATCRVPDPIAIPDQYKKSFVGLKDLDVFFMVETAKMSPKLRLQKRVLVVLYAQLYSCYDDGNITRQIRIPSISELIVKDLDVVIRVPLDLDLWVRLPDQATVRRLLEVLTSLHFKHIGSPLRVSSVPPQLQLGCTQFPVKLSKPDKLVHLDPVTQHQTPLQRPDDVGSEAETRYKARGSVPPPPSNPPSEGVVMLADPPNAVGYTLPLHLQQQQPPPPPPEEEEEDVDTATGLLTAGNVVVGGDSHYPTVELVETQQDGLTQGVVTLTPEQLASAQGGPIKINLQIMTLNGEPSQVSSRAGSLTPGTTIPPPPSRSASGEPHLPAPTEVPLSEPSPVSESRPASRPASRPVSMVSVAERSEPALVSQFVPPPPPSEPARSEAATSRAAVSQHATPLQPAASQPSVVQPLSQPPLSCHTVSAPTPQQAPVSHVPVSQVSVQVQSHPQPSMQEVPVQAQVSSHDATTQAQPPTAQHTDVQTMHTGGIDERPRVMTETKGVYVRADDGQLRSAAPSVQFKPSPVSLPASALRTPASAALLPADLPESPLGRMVTVEIPNTDGSSQVVQVPEASYPSVEAMVHQILDARESLKKKDQQLSAVLGLTQKSNTLKKERTEERIHELLDRNKETEAELEQLRGELRITKHKVVAEKEAHLNDLAAATAVHERPQPQPQPVVPPSQMANFSPGGRLHRSMPLNSARVSPVRHHGGGGSPHSSRQRKPARQYSHSPVPPVEPVCPTATPFCAFVSPVAGWVWGGNSTDAIQRGIHFWGSWGIGSVRSEVLPTVRTLPSQWRGLRQRNGEELPTDHTATTLHRTSGERLGNDVTHLPGHRAAPGWDPGDPVAECNRHQEAAGQPILAPPQPVVPSAVRAAVGLKVAGVYRTGMEVPAGCSCPLYRFCRGHAWLWCVVVQGGRVLLWRGCRSPELSRKRGGRIRKN